MKRLADAELSTALAGDERAAEITRDTFEQWSREKRRPRRLPKRWAKTTTRKPAREIVLEANLPFGVVTTTTLLAEAERRGLSISRTTLDRLQRRGDVTPGDYRCSSGGRGQPSLTWRLNDTLAALEALRTA